MKHIDLSVGITAHDEGYLAHKTIRCVLKSLERVEESGYVYEIVINIDRGDSDTKSYLKRYEEDKRFKILYSDFGDLGLSRNNIAVNARGKYLAFIDADDLISLNWYIEAIRHLEMAKRELILHPAKELIFGTDLRPVCCNINDSFDKAGDAMILAGCNRWTSTVFGLRKTFLEHPYMETGGGYGYEDYYFNTEVIADGIRHEIVPETVMFYRRKRVSLLSRSDADRVIQPYTRLLDIDYLKTIPKPKGAEVFDGAILKKQEKNAPKYKQTEFSKKLPVLLQQPYLTLRNNRRINALIIPVAKATKRALGRTEVKEKISIHKDITWKIPDFLINSWKDMNSIEPQLYPSPYILKHEFEFYYTDGLNRKVGPALWYLAQTIPKLPDYVFIVPWLIPGGSEKVLLNYINALSVVHPEWSIAVITTEKQKNTWKYKLSENAYLVEFGNVAAKLDDIEKDFLFSRLITQLRANRLHIIQSNYGYRWIANHQKLISSNYHVNVSIFCNSLVNHPDGTEIIGYIDPRLFEIYNVVDNIFTDNRDVIKYILDLDGYNDEKKFKVHYQPVEIPEVEWSPRRDDGCFRILWASRISKQKQPEMVNKIAERLRERVSSRFIIDVYGSVDKEEYDKNPISSNENVMIRGGFSNFADIQISDYDMFLYTSQYDGLPNILLEAAAAGLPIVSSNVGGISELIHNKESGILVDDCKSVEQFVKAIKYIMNNKSKAKAFGREARACVKARHSFDKYIETIKKDLK